MIPNTGADCNRCTHSKNSNLVTKQLIYFYDDEQLAGTNWKVSLEE